MLIPNLNYRRGLGYACSMGVANYSNESVIGLGGGGGGRVNIVQIHSHLNGRENFFITAKEKLKFYGERTWRVSRTPSIFNFACTPLHRKAQPLMKIWYSAPLSRAISRSLSSTFLGEASKEQKMGGWGKNVARSGVSRRGKTRLKWENWRAGKGR